MAFNAQPAPVPVRQPVCTTAGSNQGHNALHNREQQRAPTGRAGRGRSLLVLPSKRGGGRGEGEEVLATHSVEQAWRAAHGPHLIYSHNEPTHLLLHTTPQGSRSPVSKKSTSGFGANLGWPRPMHVGGCGTGRVAAYTPTLHTRGPPPCVQHIYLCMAPARRICPMALRPGHRALHLPPPSPNTPPAIICTNSWQTRLVFIMLITVVVWFRPTSQPAPPTNPLQGRPGLPPASPPSACPRRRPWRCARQLGGRCCSSGAAAATDARPTYKPSSAHDTLLAH